MKHRITVRLNKELESLMNKVENINLMNLSAITREALRKYLTELILLDISGKGQGLEKGEADAIRTN